MSRRYIGKHRVIHYSLHLAQRHSDEGNNKTALLPVHRDTRHCQAANEGLIFAKIFTTEDE